MSNFRLHKQSYLNKLFTNEASFNNISTQDLLINDNITTEGNLIVKDTILSDRICDLTDISCINLDNTSIDLVATTVLINGAPISPVFKHNYLFSTSISGAVSPGFFRFDNITPASLTEISINYITESGINIFPLLQTIEFGDIIYLCNQDSSNCKLLNITGSTDQGTYFDFNATLESQNNTSNYSSTEEIHVLFYIKNNPFNQNLNTTNDVQFNSVSTNTLEDLTNTTSITLDSTDIDLVGNILINGSPITSSDLQSVYDASTTPEIVTDTTNVALTIQRGSTADTDNVLEIRNGAGTVTTSITGDGIVATNTIEDLTNTTSITLDSTDIDLVGNILINGSPITSSDLQSVYDASTTPEIVTDTTNVALTIQRGSTADTDNVLEIRNGAGTVTSSITGAGTVSTNTIATTTQFSPLVVENSGGIILKSPTGNDLPINFGIFTTVTDKTVNTAGSQNIFGDVVGSVVFDGFVVGSTVAAKLGGSYTCANNDDISWQLMGGVTGTTIIYDSGAINCSGSSTNNFWELEFEFTTRSVGPSGSALIQVSGHFNFINNTGNFNGGSLLGTTNANLDLTIINIFGVQVTLLNPATQSITSTICVAHKIF